MTVNADLDERLIIRRVVRLMAVLTLLGAAAWALLLGPAGVKSFLAGAALSWLSFFLLHRLVSDAGRALEGQTQNPFSFLLHAFRTLILGGAAYVILKAYEAHPTALVTGLLVTVTAAVVEVLIEQFYAS